MQCKAFRKNCGAYLIGNEIEKTIDAGPFYSSKALKEHLINYPDDKSKVYVCDYRYEPYTITNKCPICGRPRKCQKPAVYGYDVCMVHGAGRPGKGKVGGGTARIEKAKRILGQGRAASFGLWQEIFDDILKDKTLATYENNIAQAELRIRQLNNRVKKSPEESEQLWKQTKAALRAYEAIRQITLDKDTEDAFSGLRSIIESAYSDEMAWSDIGKWIIKHNRLVDSKNRHEREMRMVISIERFHAYTEMIGQIFVGVLMDKNIENNEDRIRAVTYQIEKLEQKELVEVNS